MNQKPDVIEKADEEGNFRVFLQALQAAGLKETLQKPGPFTILAPVDDAFLRIPQAKLENLFRMENRDALRSMLRNHIIEGTLSSNELKDCDEVTSLKGEELKIESRAGLWVNEAQVVTPDLKASNGVVHGIDTVLMQTPVAATH